MKIKSLPLLIVLLVPNASLIAETQPVEAKELIELKSKYRAALKSLEVRYVSELERLLKAATQLGDLRGALAVQQELDKQKKPTRKEVMAAITAIWGNWTWNPIMSSDARTITFSADGVASHTGVRNVTWSMTGDDEITIVHPEKGKAVIRFTPDLLTFHGVGYNGKPVVGTRMDF